MPLSHYQSAASEARRRQLIIAIETLLHQPAEGDQAAWEDFMRDTIGLPLCYLDSVRKVIDHGRWKAKLDQVGFIRKTAQTAAFAFLGLLAERKDRTKIHVGRAIDEDQKRPPTLEEALKFTPPKRRPAVYAGSIADLSLPRFMETNEVGSYSPSMHDAAVDYFSQTYGQEDFCDLRRQRNIAPDVLKPLNAELLDELKSEALDWDDPIWDPKVNWARVADKADLDKGERMVLKCKLNGESRDSVMARQRSQEKLHYVQAAWRRFDRKWSRIVEAIKGSPSEPPVTPAPIALSNNPMTAPEALRRLQERREAEKSKRRLEPGDLPSMPRYTDYAL